MFFFEIQSQTSWHALLIWNRLGLGANITKYHIQQAEDLKLKNKLLSTSNGIGKKRLREDELILPIASTSSSKLGNDSDDDDRESKSKSFNKVTIDPFHNNNLTLSKNNKKLKNNNNKNNLTFISPLPSTSNSNPSLSNPETPTKSSPANSISMPTPPGIKIKKVITPISFYGTLPNSTTSTASTSTMSGLSKNQRKKERDRERKQAAKRSIMEESRADFLLSNSNGNGKNRNSSSEEDEDVEEAEESISSILPSPVVLKDNFRKRLVKPPFAPIDSSSGGEDSVKVNHSNIEIEKVKKDEDDSDVEDNVTALTNGNGNTVMNGEVTGKKKQKRRKKKKKSIGGEGNTSLLNLTSRVESSP